jgi:malonyl CoA-acyl carrier protein transacylase/acyl carrier protein
MGEMMKSHAVAALFPGQGAYYAGALSEARWSYPEVDSTFSAIDAVAAEMLGRTVSEALRGPNPPGIEELVARDPELLQLAIYALSVGTYQVLEARQLRPTVLMGHSFGEIAALVCAGAFTVREGAEIVCHRTAALKKFATGSGYMAALGMDAARARQVVELVGNHHTVVAVENYAGQSVVSGPGEVMDAVGQLAGVLRVPLVRLQSPYPFHSPLLSPAVEELAARLRHLRQGRLQLPVYSPIMERRYADDDALTECLAQHLVRPVRFAAAVQQLHAEGTTTFVECGALDTLGKIVRRALPDAQPTTIACLDPQLGDGPSLERALLSLRGQGLLRAEPAIGLGATLLPGVDRVLVDAFWAARGERVLEFVRREFESFGPSDAAVPAPLAAPTAAVAAPPAAVPIVPAPVAVVPAPWTPAASAHAAVSAGPTITRAELLKELCAMYAEALEYPIEVFTEHVELEAELGVDSVKQTELMARVSERYHLPPPPADMKLGGLNTMGKVADLVHGLIAPSAGRASAATAAPIAA